MTSLCGSQPSLAFKAGGPHYLMRFSVEQATSANNAAEGGNAGLIAMGDG